jgi:hypothetical protein
MNRRRFVITLLALLALLLATSGATGQGPDPEGEVRPRGDVSIAGTVNSRISYQGRLLEDDAPVTGSRDMVFRLYSDGTCATQVGSDIVKNGVQVTDGLFSVELGVTHSDFNGQGLWLEVEVGSTTVGCQEILPVPYALSLRPGAEIDDTASTINFNRYQLVPFPTITTHKYGIEAEVDGSYSYAYGLYGSATATDGTAYGVFGMTGNSDPPAAGVYGEGGHYGVSGKGDAFGVNGEGLLAGVRGYNDSGHGIIGIAADTSGQHYGVWGSSSSSTGDSSGVFGKSTATSGQTYGVRGESESPSGTGVYGKVSYPGSGAKYAGYFECDSETGYGVYSTVNGRYTSWAVRGEATGSGSGGAWFSTTAENRCAVYGNASATGGSVYNMNTGGHFVAAGDNGRGVLAIADGTYGTGIVARGGPSGHAADFSGNVRIRSRDTGETVIELGEGLDYAEGFDVSDDTEIVPGTVLVIDPDSPGRLTVSNAPYDRKVAGIVAGARGMGSAVSVGPDQFDFDVALAGRVYCYVDATQAGVEPGDLLTTSATPGYAMKVTDYVRAQGAILGKAMQRLEMGEKGLILVLVTLQ